MLSTVSLLDRSTAVSMVGFLGLRRNLGIRSMAGMVETMRMEEEKKKRPRKQMVMAQRRINEKRSTLGLRVSTKTK